VKSILVLILLCVISLEARDITLSWLKSKPKSYARDFYIYRFFDKNITSQEALEALDLVKNVNSKIFIKYAKKSNNNSIQYIANYGKL